MEDDPFACEKGKRKLVLDTSHPLSIDPAELWRINITNEFVLLTCVHSKMIHLGLSRWPTFRENLSQKINNQKQHGFIYKNQSMDNSNQQTNKKTRESKANPWIMDSQSKDLPTPTPTTLPTPYQPYNLSCCSTGKPGMR